MRVSLILLAAGRSKRFPYGKKQFYKVFRKEVFKWSLLKFKKFKEFTETILVLPKEEISYYREKLKDVKLTEGGRTRYDSVKNALKLVSEDSEYVCIHDAVRALVSERLIRKLLRAAKRYQSVIPGVKVKETIKLANDDGFVEKTIPREKLFSIQTPQIFKRELIIEGYQRKYRNATDDSFLLEMMNKPVKIINGEYRNIKITTEEDIPLVKYYLRNENRNRVRHT